MKKIYVLLILLFVVSNVYADEIAYKQGDTIVVFNVDDTKFRTKIMCQGIQGLELVSCCKSDSSYIFLLYDRDYYYNIKSHSIIEKTLTIKNGEIISVCHDTIFEKANHLYSKSHPDRVFKGKSVILDLIEPLDGFERRRGSVVLKNSDGKTEIIKNVEKCGKYDIGYFSPCLSNKKDKIVCTRIKAKHDWRKVVSNELVEIDVNTKEALDTNLKGHCLGFSSEDRYILFFRDVASKTSFFIYDFNTKEIVANLRATNALWVKSLDTSLL